MEKIIDYTKPIRIYLFIDSFLPEHDGNVIVVDSLAKEFVKKGIDVRIVTVKKKHDCGPLPYKVLRNKAWATSSKYPFSHMTLSREVRADIESYNGPIVFNYHSPFFLGSAAEKYAKKNHIPVLGTLHTKLLSDYINMLKIKCFARFLVKKMAKLMMNANRLLSLSEGAIKELKLTGFKGQYYLVRNTTPSRVAENLEENKNEWRKELGIKEDDNIVLFVGHLTWVKNLKTVFDTMKLCEDSGFKFKLFVAGEGCNEKEIKKYVAKLDYKNEVRFLGQISNYNRLAALYSIGDIFFFPSIFDTYPLVVNEAAFFATPTLCIEDTDTSRIVTNNKTGYTAKNSPKAMRDKIIEIFSDRNKLHEVSENAKREIPKSWAEISESYQKHYLEVLEEFYGNDKKMHF